MTFLSTSPELEDAISHHFAIADVRVAQASDLAIEDRAILNQTAAQAQIVLRGRLRSSAAALDAALARLNAFALLREDATGQSAAPHRLILCSPRPAPAAPPRVWLALLLFIATVFSVLYTGTIIAIGEIGLSNPREAARIASDLLPNLWRGLPYALSIILILGAHELGHFFTMRRYEIASSLPHFIPALGISPFGTFGAAIALRGPVQSRTALFDMGASGPIMGLIFTLPILFFGLATSPVIQVSGGIVEGNSAFYALAKILVLGRFLPADGVDVLLNQFAWAGWTGLFVTALNLIPLGQLDGGHVTYALFGPSARRLVRPLLALVAFLVLFVSQIWLIFGLLLLAVGSIYAVPLDDITPLDERRRRIGYGLLLVFVLIFVPIPLSGEGAGGGLLTGLFGVLTWTSARNSLTRAAYRRT
ncbi:MAG: site-2 protease family protein [Anaerolineae bacterium]|nr:site-2 protease family protein [Anaerolineae bacterium]MDW8173917.1 site-2 protease family protein [Anaerolineae bacterium]